MNLSTAHQKNDPRKELGFNAENKKAAIQAARELKGKKSHTARKKAKLDPSKCPEK